MVMRMTQEAQARQAAACSEHACTFCGAVAPYYIEARRHWVCAEHMVNFVNLYAKRVNTLLANGAGTRFEFRRKHSHWYELYEDGVKVADARLRGPKWYLIRNGEVEVIAYTLPEIQRHLDSLAA